jgi:hypothetical protein
LRQIAVAGNSDSREGYGATQSALAAMRAEFSNDTAACPVKLALGPFDAETYQGFDFILTADKIAHVLAAVYVSRIFVRFTLLSRVFICAALATVVALSVFGYYTYAAAAVALLAASRVLSVYRIGKMTSRLSFSSVSRYRFICK